MLLAFPKIVDLNTCPFSLIWLGYNRRLVGIQQMMMTDHMILRHLLLCSRSYLWVRDE